MKQLVQINCLTYYVTMIKEIIVASFILQQFLSVQNIDVLYSLLPVLPDSGVHQYMLPSSVSFLKVSYELSTDHQIRLPFFLYHFQQENWENDLLFETVSFFIKQ